MMLFDEIIQLMIGLKDDQLKKIKDFILMKLFYCDLQYNISRKIQLASWLIK